MSDLPLPLEYQRPALRGTIFYYGWINVLIAAFAMVATLPGRTQGLGLITEPLLRDLKVSPLDYAGLNAWATLIGATFCLACGPLIDRYGVRALLTWILAALAATVIAMSHIHGKAGLLITLILTRGFGQSALSVVSLTIVGKWFVRWLPIAMGVYSVLIGVGFIAAFTIVGYAAMHAGWRPVWQDIGWALAVLMVIGWLFTRNSPESMGLTVDGGGNRLNDKAESSSFGFTLPQALQTPAFWAFALSGTVFALVSTGLMLFNEAVLTERGFPKEMMIPVIAVITLMGLLANFGAGFLGELISIGRMMGGAMFFLAVSLCMLPLAHTKVMVYGYAVAIGIAGGIVTVVFFVCWAKVFGRKHLGSIQGAAQLLTVLGSATGPVVLQLSVHYTHSSSPLLFALAPLVALLGVVCLLVPLPVAPMGEDSR